MNCLHTTYRLTYLQQHRTVSVLQRGFLVDFFFLKTVIWLNCSTFGWWCIKIWLNIAWVGLGCAGFNVPTNTFNIAWTNVQVWTMFNNYWSPVGTEAAAAVACYECTRSRILLSGLIRIPQDPDPNLDYFWQEEKNCSFCTTTGKLEWLVNPILWPNFYMSDNFLTLTYCTELKWLGYWVFVYSSVLSCIIWWNERMLWCFIS